MTIDFSAILAQESGGASFSVVKILLFLALSILTWHNAAWVDKDTMKIKAQRAPWTVAIFGTGTLCLVVWMLVPIFWVGLIIWAVGYGVPIIWYCIYHNGRVSPAQTVLTGAHFQRIIAPKAETKETVHSQDRVRIQNAEGKTPDWPTDPDMHAGFQGMQDLLFDAIWRRASDVRMDLVPNQDVRIVYKVDGVERSREPIEAQLGVTILHHLKEVAGADPTEHRRPQGGNFTAAIGAGDKGQQKVDVDLKTSGSTAGQRLVLKIFAEEAKLRLNEIGLTADQLAAFEPVVKSSKGVIIVSGPRASGVTTTLYSLLRSHDAFIQNINTLEMNKALDLENVTQNVFEKGSSEVTFAKRFQSMLRTDPDVALASDTPDADTARLAAEHGRQGKRIYLGMPAKDAFTALRQYAHLVGDAGDVAVSLAAVMNQRLVRKLCQTCRKGYRPDPGLLKKANLPTDKNRPFYRPPNPNEVEVDKQGNPIICAVCQGSGYLGRVAVIELIIVDDAMRKQIASGASVAQVKAEARKRDMLYLQELAIQKVWEGVTSINEVLRVTRDAAPKKAAVATK